MIGIIDSGLGGLAVAEAVWQRLPKQATVYLADHAYFPYGNKSAAEINRRLRKIIDWLIGENCQIIVIACNTITATAIDRLRRRYRLPIVGTEPAVKLGGVVLATPATAKSRRYRQLAAPYQVKTVACPGLAEAIEADKDIRPLLPALPVGVKIVSLGCTHYLLVKDKIGQFYGRRVRLVDPSVAIARQVQKKLVRPENGQRQFFTTGDPRPASIRASRLLKRRIIFSRCSL